MREKVVTLLEQGGYIHEAKKTLSINLLARLERRKTDLEARKKFFMQLMPFINDEKDIYNQDRSFYEKAYALLQGNGLQVIY